MKIIIVINILLSILIYIAMRNQRKGDVLFCSVVIATMPGAGVLLVLGYKIMNYFMGSFTSESNHSVEDKEDSINIMITGNFKEKTDVIAVSEALVINDRKTKKEALINILREDKSKYIETLKEAVQDEDTEASHYGAVALMGIKDSFNNVLEKWENQLKGEDANKVDLDKYAEVLEKSINSGLNDSIRQKMLEYRYTNLLGKLIKQRGHSKDLYNKKINIDIQIGNYEEADNYCNIFIKQYPDNEEPYLSLMKLYYVTQNHEKFNQVLDNLKKSRIILSRKGLEIVRFWIGGTNEL